MAPSVFLEIYKSRIVVEPSFSLARLEGTCKRRLENIHTTYDVEVTANRVVLRYTRGFEGHETLAAIIAVVADCGNVTVEELVIVLDEEESEQYFDYVDTAVDLAVLIQAEYRLVEALKEATEKECDVKSAERDLAYETDNRNSLIKKLRNDRKLRLELEAPDGSPDWLVLVTAIEEVRKRLVDSRSYINREGPKVRGRRTAINNRLASLKAEALALEPWLRSVRPELRAQS